MTQQFRRDPLTRRWSIRSQLSAVAAVAVAIPLVVGALLLTAILDLTLTNSLVTSTQNEARRLSEVITLESPAELGGHQEIAHGVWLQLLDPHGRVVVSAPRVDPSPRSALRPAPGVSVTEGVLPWWTPPGDRDHDIVTALGFVHDGEPLVLLVGTSQTGQLEASWTAAMLLLSGTPVLMLSAALVAWWVTGRALDPVVRMRAQVEQITARQLSRRVPIPGARDEVWRLAVTMNDMLGRLEASQTAQARFVADASHELRSPLTTLAGALEIAQQADDERTWRELAPLMATETDRLTKLVQDLLLLSRTDEGGLVRRVTDVDLDDLAWAEVRRLREAGGVRVITDIGATRVTGDPLALSQVLRNLCDNAARHARSEVAIHVHQDADGGAILVVADDGVGIDPADRERVFERFVRLDDSRSRDLGGSGLGLPIVAQVTKAHSGSVLIGESLGGGATFTVHLPACPPNA